jgi:SAM-dependent methyltransferase
MWSAMTVDTKSLDSRRTGPDRLTNIGLQVYRRWRLYIEPERLRMRSSLRRWVQRWEPGSKVLEVGGGTSFLKPVIESEVPAVMFVSGEIAPTNQTDVVLDATALPIATQAFDAVLALEVLEHMPNPQLLLSEASRVLRPGGQLIITVPFMFGVHDYRDYYRYTPLGFSTMLGKCGLTLTDTRQRGGTFVASTGLIRNLILNTIVGEPKDWRAQGKTKKVLWMVATVVLTPWTLVTWAAYALDGLLDRDSKSPPGYFFLCTRLAD